MNQMTNIAIVGATGVVGKAMLEVLEARNFPLNQLFLLASERSENQSFLYKKEKITVQSLDAFDFSQVQIALFAIGSELTKRYVPEAVNAGCVVIDNSSTYRYDPDVPLVIPEVNAYCIADYVHQNIIANPNCSTIQMLVALKPIHDAVGIKRINVATYQSVSGSGKQAISELITQLGQLLNGKPAKSEVYAQQIAFNVLPHIDEFLENNYTREEMKMVWETQKILADDRILVNPTAVRVPVLYGHSEAIHLELMAPLSVDEARATLRQAPGVKVIDDPKKQHYPTPFTHAIGQDKVLVGRIREDISHPCGLNLWVVADNIRKGAATNAVQIAEILQQQYL